MLVEPRFLKDTPRGHHICYRVKIPQGLLRARIKVWAKCLTYYQIDWNQSLSSDLTRYF